MAADAHFEFREKRAPDTYPLIGGRRLDVLVVHPDPAERRAIEQAVVELGYACRVAGDSRVAWNLHRGERADVIVSAWKLPYVDGVELCRKTRAADDSGAYTYFILTVGPNEAPLVRALRTDADDFLIHPIDIGVLRGRLASVARQHAVVDKLAAENAALRRDGQTSFRLARVDPLTGVGNRLRMEEDIAVVWAQAQRYGRASCAALADIDWFKSYNDTHGHLAGDQVLRRVAQVIRSRLRRGDMLYRYGGEEFLALLPDPAQEARAAMDRVRREVERLRIVTPAGRGVVTVSIGVAVIGAHDSAPLDWLGRTDRALYAAKAKGRNRVEVDREAAFVAPARARGTVGTGGGSVWQDR